MTGPPEELADGEWCLGAERAARAGGGSAQTVADHKEKELHESVEARGCGQIWLEAAAQTVGLTAGDMAGGRAGSEGARVGYEGDQEVSVVFGDKVARSWRGRSGGGDGMSGPRSDGSSILGIRAGL